MHAKKSDFLYNTKDFKGVSNKSVVELKKLIDKYKTPHPAFAKKKDLIKVLEDYKTAYSLTEIKPERKQQYIHKLDFIQIGKNIRDYFNNPAFNNTTHVIIECQMTAKMKQIQSQLAQHFISSDPTIHVEFINPSNKLKNYDTDNSTYGKRKKNAVDICNEYFTENQKEWKPVLDKEKKKDDLCDCFLQGKWFIENTGQVF
jgi:hypothetical protein